MFGECDNRTDDQTGASLRILALQAQASQSARREAMRAHVWHMACSLALWIMTPLLSLGALIWLARWLWQRH